MRLEIRRRYHDQRLETSPREELRAHQFARVKALLERVYPGNAFYRRLFDEAKVRPDQVRSWDDFQKRIPFIDKRDLLTDQTEHPPHGRKLMVPEQEIRKVYITSGTSGIGQEFHPMTDRDFASPPSLDSTSSPGPAWSRETGTRSSGYHPAEPVVLAEILGPGSGGQSPSPPARGLRLRWDVGGVGGGYSPGPPTPDRRRDGAGRGVRRRSVVSQLRGGQPGSGGEGRGSGPALLWTHRPPVGAGDGGAIRRDPVGRKMKRGVVTDPACEYGGLDGT